MTCEWHQTHRDELRAYTRRWKKANPEKVKEQNQRHAKRHRPEINARGRADYRKNYLESLLKNINKRCTLPSHVPYPYYGGKGIKNFLTLDDLRFLWVRDGAASLKRPSIDRIDSNIDYVLENCRFIELSENIRRRFH